MSECSNIGYEWLPEKVWGAVPILADIYYSFMTICQCRKRLGEEYTYVVKFNEKHYEEEGVLMNRKYRILMFVLEILQRHIVKKVMSAAFQRIETSQKAILR